MTDDNPMFAEVTGAFPHLFEATEKWDQAVKDPAEPFVPVPDPSFEELMDQLIKGLPETAVESIRAEVWAAVELQQAEDYEEVGDDSDGGPAGDAEGADPDGAGVVELHGGAEPEGEDGGAEPAA